MKRSLVALLLVALVCVPMLTSARPKKGARHAWDRPVGHRHRQQTLADKNLPFVRTSQMLKVDASPRVIEPKLMALAAHPDIRIELITPKYAMMPVYRVDLPAKGMRAGDKPLQAVISGGIHGNEPVGFHAAPAFMKWAANNKGYRRRFHTTAFIKLDPYGTRDTAYGINLNRSFQDGRWTPETSAIRRSLTDCDVFVDLHNTDGRKTRGAWLVRAANDNGVSQRSLAALRTDQLWDVSPQKSKVTSDVCNCDFNFHSLGGVTSNSTGTFKWFMAKRGTPYSFTLETPNDRSIEQQTRMALKALKSTLFNVAKHGDPKLLAGR